MMRETSGSAKKRQQDLTAIQYAVKLLSARPYSEKKLGEKLQARGYGGDEIRLALNRLREQNLIDDRRFAEDFTRARLAVRPRAASVLTRELIQRGIPLHLAKAVAEQTAPHNEEEVLAQELVKRKRTMYAALDPLTRKRRLMAYLARRGFSYETIEKVLHSENDLAADD